MIMGNLVRRKMPVSRSTVNVASRGMLRVWNNEQGCSGERGSKRLGVFEDNDQEVSQSLFPASRERDNENEEQ